MLTHSLQGLRQGHWPSLIGGGLHFTVSCMVWVLIGGLGISISEAFSLTATQKGLLVATPLLGGALLRLLIGPLVDYRGAKTIGMYVLLLEMLALFCGWLGGDNYSMMIGVAFLLGIAGSSFAVAVPIASHAYPPQHQGLAMGVVAMGNSGVLFATLLAPRLSDVVGWQNTFGFMTIPVFITAIIFYYSVQDHSLSLEENPRQSFTLEIFKDILRQKFMYWLCFLYGITFGGFVGLSSFLPIFFHDQYQVNMITAGTLTALCSLAGSVARPIGGHLADRFGGIGLLLGLFPVLTLIGLALSQLLPIIFAFLLTCGTLLLLGFGNGVVFQLASIRFRQIMGTASGLIGAAGALGGFLLPTWFGILKDFTGTFASGFWVLSFVTGMAGLSVYVAQRSFRFSIQRSI